LIGSGRALADSGERSPTIRTSDVSLLLLGPQTSRHEHTLPGAGVLLVRVQDGPAGEGLRDNVLGVHREGADGDGWQA